MSATREEPMLGSGTGILFRALNECLVCVLVTEIGVRATTGHTEGYGKGSNGGVWEWTSTVFDNHDGLIPTQLFTGYSTDFFDTKHQVVVSSFAKSYRNCPEFKCDCTARCLLRHHPQVGPSYCA